MDRMNRIKNAKAFLIFYPIHPVHRCYNFCRGFTLIEVLVCLLLLSMVGGVMVYKGWGMLQEHRFSTSCEKISSEIALTKGLAISYQRDIDMILEQRGSKVYLMRKSEGLRVLQADMVLTEIAFSKDNGVK